MKNYKLLMLVLITSLFISLGLFSNNENAKIAYVENACSCTGVFCGCSSGECSSSGGNASCECGVFDCDCNCDGIYVGLTDVTMSDKQRELSNNFESFLKTQTSSDLLELSKLVREVRVHLLNSNFNEYSKKAKQADQLINNLNRQDESIVNNWLNLNK